MYEACNGVCILIIGIFKPAVLAKLKSSEVPYRLVSKSLELLQQP